MLTTGISARPSRMPPRPNRPKDAKKQEKKKSDRSLTDESWEEQGILLAAAVLLSLACYLLEQTSEAVRPVSCNNTNLSNPQIRSPCRKTRPFDWPIPSPVWIQLMRFHSLMQLLTGQYSPQHFLLLGEPFISLDKNRFGHPLDIKFKATSSNPGPFAKEL